MTKIDHLGAQQDLRPLIDGFWQGTLSRAERHELALALTTSTATDPAFADELELLATALAAERGLVHDTAPSTPLTSAESRELWNGIRAALPVTRSPWWSRLLPSLPVMRWVYSGAALAALAIVAGIGLQGPGHNTPARQDKGGGVAELVVEALIAERRGDRWNLKPGRQAEALSAGDRLMLQYSVSETGFLGVARMHDDEVEVIVPDEDGAPYPVDPGQHLLLRDNQAAGIDLTGLSGDQILVVLWKKTPLAAADVITLTRRVTAHEPSIRSELTRQGVTFTLLHVTVGP